MYIITGVHTQEFSIIDLITLDLLKLWSLTRYRIQKWAEDKCDLMTQAVLNYVESFILYIKRVSAVSCPTLKRCNKTNRRVREMSIKHNLRTPTHEAMLRLTWGGGTSCKK